MSHRVKLTPPSSSLGHDWSGIVTKVREQIWRYSTLETVSPPATADAGSGGDWLEGPNGNMFHSYTGSRGTGVWSSQEWLEAFDTLVRL